MPTTQTLQESASRSRRSAMPEATSVSSGPAAAYRLLPEARRSLFHSFIDSNPFYLLSACCMLAGCLALTNSLSWLSIPLPKLLILLLTLNVYEGALIGLAAYLVLVRGLRRDGMMLVILEAFFLIDIT